MRRVKGTSAQKIEVEGMGPSDDTATHKPSPEPLLHALNQMGADAADAVYVGDAIVDMQAARAAGVRGIGVTWGAASAEELRAAEPTAVVHSVGELQTLLGL